MLPGVSEMLPMPEGCTFVAGVSGGSVVAPAGS